jgi:Flp pilus assembly protein TadD
MTEAICQPSGTRTAVRSTAAAAAVLIALGLGACGQSNPLSLGLESERLKTSDIATSSAGPRPEAELEKATAYWGEQHAKNPRDPKTALSFARNLKAMGRKAQALSVLQSTYMHAPEDKEFLSEYGRLALELGQVSTAGQLLARADDPAKPEWRVLSARGTVHAKQGRYKEAIEYYERARALAPDQASVLNNLGMAFTMNGEAARGEELLRQAAAMDAADPRVERNLALVRELQGKSAANVASAPQPVATAPMVTAAVPQAAVASQSRSTTWDKPLPIEASSAPARAQRAAAPPIDTDEVIRQALAAEQAMNSRR